MTAQSNKVNLLPPSEFELSFWGRFLKWAVTTGRRIIIVVELIVIVAFLSRFKLDEDLRNLNEQINLQMTQLQNQQSQEDEFLKVQKRLNLMDNLFASRFQVVKRMDYVVEKLPAGVDISKRTFTYAEISLTADTLSEQSMGELLSTLSADLQWRSVDMTELVGDRTKGIRFSLSAKK
jgi:hypothetical protein